MGVLVENALPVTSLWAGVLAIGMVSTALVTGLTRAGSKTFYGAKEKSPLQYRSRACGTIQEYGIWGIGLLALLEYNTVLPAGRLWWWGAAFTGLRFTHALQLVMPDQVPQGLRVGSFLSTLGLLGYAALQLISSGRRAN